MAELIAGVKAPQDAADSALDWNSSLRDDKTERLGIYHFSVSHDGEAGEYTGLPSEGMNKCVTSRQGNHSAGIASQSRVQCCGIGIPALPGTSDKIGNAVSSKTNPEIQRNQITVRVATDVEAGERHHVAMKYRETPPLDGLSHLIKKIDRVYDSVSKRDRLAGHYRGHFLANPDQVSASRPDNTVNTPFFSWQPRLDDEYVIVGVENRTHLDIIGSFSLL